MVGAAGAAVIRFDSVSFTHVGADAPALRDLSFSITEGELCVVIGRTGVGKSTLLGTINGLVPHFTGGHMVGDVVVNGRLDPRRASRATSPTSSATSDKIRWRPSSPTPSKKNSRTSWSSSAWHPR